MNTHGRHNVRCHAAQVLVNVLQKGRSLADALPTAQQKISADDRPLLAELCYGTLRFFFELEAITQVLLQKPLHDKDADVQALLLTGLYQLRHMRIAEHTAVNLTVDACKILKKPWAEKLLNGVLRTYLRRRAEMDATVVAQNPQALYNHPQWLIDAITTAWPKQAPDIFAANNQQGYMCLRINQRQKSIDTYQQKLLACNINATRSSIAPHALQLERAIPVTALPDFFEGACSVQDIAAQLCAPLLQLAPGQRVLDACCAPGGKTGHILESEPALSTLIALDREAKRLSRVEENLQRLQLQATVMRADAAQLQQWHDGKLFDRILLDAPCSGTGVIRRHPDIKHLRRPTDIAALAEKQLQILEALWETLAPGGILLYTTCSILLQENEAVIEQFLRTTSNASLHTIESDWGITLPHGKQLLPSVANDGFYYARLRKNLH